MRSNALRQRQHGGGKAYSLITAQRDMTVRIADLKDRPKTVRVWSLATGETFLCDESDLYVATGNSWKPVDRKRPHSEVLREILASGAVFATSKALFRQALNPTTEVADARLPANHRDSRFLLSVAHRLRMEPERGMEES